MEPQQHKKLHKNITFPSLLPKFYSSRKSIEILLSLSLLSFLFSQSSLLPLFSPSFSIKIFNYSNDRNYIFLLCNGILFLIIKNSGLFSNVPTDTELREDRVTSIVRSDESKDFKKHDVEKNDQSHQSNSETIQVYEAKNKISAKEETDENVISSSARVEVEDEDQIKDDNTKLHIADYEDEKDIEEEQSLKIIEHEDEQKDEEDLTIVEENADDFIDTIEKREANEGLLSAEELHKKCDDFIRKMKDGIKVEAQHLTMVYCQS